MRYFKRWVAYLLFCAPALALAGWSQIGDTAQSTHYIDRATIKQVSNHYEVWWLMNLKPHLFSQVGFSSVVGYEKIDCRAGQTQNLKKTSFMQINGEGIGTVITPTKDWTVSRPGDLQDNLIRTICQK